MIKCKKTSIDAAAALAGVAPLELPPATPKISKLDAFVGLLSARGGTTIAELMAVTGWQQHSVRGAMAGALKQRGHVVKSEKVVGERRYRIDLPVTKKSAA